MGYHLAARLSENHDVTVIERDPDLADRIQSALDVIVVQGNGASLTCLERAGIQEAALLLAVTNFDEVNLIACLIASQFGVGFKVARVSNPEYSDGKIEEKSFGADLLINPEQECAREILKLFHRLAASDVAALELPDLQIRVYAAGGAGSLEEWLTAAQIGPPGWEPAAPFSTPNVNGLRLCLTTMLAPGCSDFVLGGGWVYQLVPGSQAGETVLGTFALIK